VTAAPNPVKPIGRRKTKAKHPSRPIERVKGDENFERGWGFGHDTKRTAHYFTPSAGKKRVSLCHLVLQDPVWIIPSTLETDRRCRMCQEYLERRHRIAQDKRERALKRHVDSRIARFLADPSLGPRLYGCPVCHGVYEGMAPKLFPCSDGGHPPTLVVELARKDTWTRDKPA
jgi:hypothetical protein